MLKSSHPDTRDIAPTGDTDAGRLNSLTVQLSSGSATEREAAARELVRFGPGAVGPLCTAVRDKVVGVRNAAAEALQEVGDERAVLPLSEALRDTAHGGATRILSVCVCALPVFLVLTLVKVPESLPWVVGVLGILMGLALWAVVSSAGSAQRTTSRSAVFLASELTAIAERHPDPALRAALPDLRVAEKEARHLIDGADSAVSGAVKRIEALTETMKSLPVASAPPASQEATLPRATASTEPAGEDLPRVTG